MSERKTVKPKTVGRNPEKDGSAAPFADTPFCKSLNILYKESSDTQDSAGKALDVSRQTFGNWLAGRNQPDLKGLTRIAEHYQVSTDYLLGLSEYKSVVEKIEAAKAIIDLNNNAMDIFNMYLSLPGEKADYNKERITEPLNSLLQTHTFYQMLSELYKLKELTNKNHYGDDLDDLNRLNYYYDGIIRGIEKMCSQLCDVFDWRSTAEAHLVFDEMINRYLGGADNG